MTSETNKSTAFTLIELLVVIAIIGILSSVVLAALSGARESARDTRRIQDARQIQTALEMYINAEGEAPLAGINDWHRSDTDHESDPGDWDILEDELEPYIDLPVDPSNSGGHHYVYRAGGSTDGDEATCDFDESEDNYLLLIRPEQEMNDLPLYSSTHPEYCFKG